MTRPNTLIDLARAFATRRIRWLVVGGYATIVHGFVRATHDLDIVLDLDPDNACAAIDVLVAMGFTPRVPVSMHDFADADQRQQWMDTREMIVFTVWREGPAGF